ncbi:glycerophosphoryl diester phosphodiesterase [Vibrio maerlii]|uniref:glycerophosphoryl diester phosphodiesterase n=1 Tax=Vibrio maerlii TaxID=2231648 RepID=UPI000E3B6C37|nr:glycerophosphoryl diester phosphodiesterase [Vibrio maerlii]
MKITAHRGLSSQAPENTIAAFDLAIEQGVEWIEIDVQLSKDDVPMVIHDQTVNRCSNGSGKVSGLSCDQLQQLDAGLWFGDAFRGEMIPTLLDTLQFAHKQRVKLNIELKVYEDDDIELLCRQVRAVIEQVDIESDQLLFSSFSTPALMSMKALLPEIRRGQLWQKVPSQAFNILEDIEAYSVHCDYRFLDQSTAKMIKEADYQLYCYTPNFPELVEQHWLWGVDMMITDIPQAYQHQILSFT